ncbi:MAG: hypothetical protein NVSMB2_20560 [Chloroflexota bacterium]
MNDSENDVGGPEDRGLMTQVGPMQVDWPRSLGYFGGIGLALALDVISPPVALFIASIPFFKMLNRPGASRPVRTVSQFLDGMAKPVGGDGASTVKLTNPESAQPDRPVREPQPRRRARTPLARANTEQAAPNASRRKRRARPANQPQP